MRNFRLLLAATVSTFLAASAVHANELLDVLQTSYRDAVLKVRVSSLVPVLDERGENICRSEGTGFIVSRTHVVTAHHVLAIPSTCGAPVVTVTSQKHKMRGLATLIAARDDLAVLSIDPVSRPLCSLMVANDIFQVSAYRFGIPGELEDPSPPLDVKIGDGNSTFGLLVPVTPVATERGESGGPIIYKFLVAGVLRARHEKYTAYSFMTRASRLKSLLADNKIEPTTDILCNPALAQITASAGATGGITTQLVLDTRLESNTKAFINNVFERQVPQRVVTVSNISKPGPIFGLPTAQLSRVCQSIPGQNFCIDVPAANVPSVVGASSRTLQDLSERAIKTALDELWNSQAPR